MTKINADYLWNLMIELRKVSESLREGEGRYAGEFELDHSGCIRVEKGTFVSGPISELGKDIIEVYHDLCADKANEYGDIRLDGRSRPISYEHVEKGHVFRFDAVDTNEEPVFQVCIEDRPVLVGSLVCDDPDIGYEFVVEECTVSPLRGKEEEVFNTLSDVAINELNLLLDKKKRVDNEITGQFSKNIESMIADFRAELDADKAVRPGSSPS
ncbi:hypothetical protein [Sulfitobacter sp. R18_1]|uniref:hypothetical protein n=1 Tax=Sulfitobacter sp. R18_1 TaxID=2821104 RepID=UPI001ADCCD83|nr:hypothetical protein [Sulfitobacter sp. R18_1]MBO9428155.1 hypothetical protein [Sulfitobacter sp. R18_1]